MPSPNDNRHVHRDTAESDLPWLLSDEAAPWLQLARESNQPLHQLAQQLRQQLSPDRTHRILELTELRRRGTTKFSQAEQMFFTRVGLEQATDQWIAAYKASRFAGCESIADLCCGIGGDTIALAQVAPSIFACDRNPVATCFAQRNLQVVLPEKTPQVRVATSEVPTCNWLPCDAWHIDPDRRPSGKRTIRPEQQEPSDEVIDQLLLQTPHAAIKLAPACQTPARWQAESELEWISRGGECRQLVMWHGRLAQQTGTRRATILDTPGHTNRPTVVRSIVGRSIVGQGEEILPYGEQVGPYLYEPDAAILAAGLVGTVAAEHHLRLFASTTGYLTGDQLVDDPGLARFAVLGVLPLQPKTIAAYLRERRIGRLEIKHRAVDLSPPALQKQLKLQGDRPATLLLTRIEKKRIAIVARRLPANTPS